MSSGHTHSLRRAGRMLCQQKLMQVYKFISDFICSRVKRFNPVKKGTKIKIHLRSYDENIKSQIDIKKVGFEKSFDMQVKKECI